MIHFRLFGIPVIVQPWHWVLLGILGFLIGDGSPLKAGLFVLAGFFSILVHEMGHALTGRAFKGNPHIVLHGFGGFALFPGANFTRPQMFLMTAAGPAGQLLLGALVMGGFIFFGDSLPRTEIRFFLYILGAISLFWSILNLIPIIPLDGGQMLDSILGPKRRNLTLSISIVVAIVTAGLMFMRMHNFLFPLFVAMFAFQNFSELRERTAKRD